MSTTQNETDRCVCSAQAHHPKFIAVPGGAGKSRFLDLIRDSLCPLEGALRALGACPGAWSPPHAEVMEQ